MKTLRAVIGTLLLVCTAGAWAGSSALDQDFIDKYFGNNDEQTNGGNGDISLPIPATLLLVAVGAVGLYAFRNRGGR